MIKRLFAAVAVLLAAMALPAIDLNGVWAFDFREGKTCQLNCSTMFGGSVAGIFDVYRRPKKSVATVRRYFETKAAGEAAD